VKTRRQRGCERGHGCEEGKVGVVLRVGVEVEVVKIEVAAERGWRRDGRKMLVAMLGLA
jgi:hypothetical protein